MKKLLVCAAAALLSLSSLATTLNPITLLNPAGSTAGQAIVSTGATSAPAWSSVVAASLSPIAANSVVANKTGSTAAPGALAVPSCSASGNTLQWTSGTGFTCATGAALTANPLSQFASTTSAQLAGVLSDKTGTGANVFAVSPTLVTPNLGTPSALTLTSATGLPISTGVSGLGTGVATGLATSATGSGGPVLATSPTISTPTLTGIVSGTTPAAGNVGEVNNLAVGTAAPTTTGTSVNCNSGTLNAGEWLIFAVATFTANVGTTTSVYAASVSTTTATLTTGKITQIYPGTSTNQTNLMTLPPYLLLVSSTTTVYIVGNSTFSGSTQTCNGSWTAVRIH